MKKKSEESEAVLGAVATTDLSKKQLAKSLQVRIENVCEELGIVKSLLAILERKGGKQ